MVVRGCGACIPPPVCPKNSRTPAHLPGPRTHLHLTVRYFRIYQVVAPKRAALADANARLDGANDKLAGIRADVARFRGRVADLEAGLLRATQDKNAAAAQAAKTEAKATLAMRLTDGLASEFARWTRTIDAIKRAEGRAVTSGASWGEGCTGRAGHCLCHHPGLPQRTFPALPQSPWWPTPCWRPRLRHTPARSLPSSGPTSWRPPGCPTCGTGACP